MRAKHRQEQGPSLQPRRPGRPQARQPATRRRCFRATRCARTAVRRASRGRLAGRRGRAGTVVLRVGWSGH